MKETIKKVAKVAKKLVLLVIIWGIVIMAWASVKDMPIWTVGGILALLGMLVVSILMGIISIVILEE